MDRQIQIDGRMVGFRATALTPRVYRHRFGRDIIRDLIRLSEAYRRAEKLPDAATEEERQAAQLSVIDLEVFENAAHVMARQYDPSIPDDPGDWLDGFGTFSIYEILPQLLELWQLNGATTAKAKKK